jgi:hypothetical protein
MSISIFLDGQNLHKVIYNKEEEFEKFIVDNAKTIFGVNSIYVDMKHRIENSSLGGTIPDGVLIDLSDLENPEFYIVEVELQNHDFRTHIYPQIDKFFDFYSNIQERNKLTEKIYSTFRRDDSLHGKLKNIIDSKEIYRFLKDTIENSQNILIIIDGPKPEIEEKMKSRLETWGKMVKVQIVNHFRNENHNIITSEPPFQNLGFGDVVDETAGKRKSDTSIYTEEFHLKDCNENVKDIYNKLKQSFLKIKSEIKFYPAKGYIGVFLKRRFTYIIFRKAKIVMIILFPEEEVRNILISQHHKIISHSEQRQRTWGTKPNCTVEICDTKHFDEIEKLLQKVVARNEEL